MNRNYINQNMRGEPFLIQFAKDYEFEKAFKIEPPYELSQQSLSDYLDDEFDNLCVEIFVKDRTGRTVVFGFTYDKTMNLEDEYNFVETCLNLVKKYTDFEKFITKAEKLLLDGTSIMYEGEPDLLRIGILDYWFSTGPALIWKYGDENDVNEDYVKDVMKDWPEIVETELNTQGISWLFGKERYGVSHWIMWQCGEKQENKYFLDYKRVMELVSGS